MAKQVFFMMRFMLSLCQHKRNRKQNWSRMLGANVTF